MARQCLQGSYQSGHRIGQFVSHTSCSNAWSIQYFHPKGTFAKLPTVVLLFAAELSCPSGRIGQLFVKSHLLLLLLGQYSTYPKRDLCQTAYNTTFVCRRTFLSQWQNGDFTSQRKPDPFVGQVDQQYRLVINNDSRE